MSVLSSISALNSKVNQFIKTNFQQLITGAVLNSTIHDIIDTLSNQITISTTGKLDKTAVGFDASGLNLPAGMTYKVNGVDIVSVLVNGGGPAGQFIDNSGNLPAVGTGLNGAIINGNFWRVNTTVTIPGLLPKSNLVPGDIIVSSINNAALVTEFYSIPGDQELAQILSRLIVIETKLATIEDHASADQTGDEIRDVLEALPDADKLDFSAVKDIASAPYVNPGLPLINTIKKGLDNANDNKVDKVQGKGLSSQDYTLIEKQKLEILQNYDPTDLILNVANKVDKVLNKGLSANDYTEAEKSKLAALNNLFLGSYLTVAALQAAYPVAPQAGCEANVDPGAGQPAIRYIWDVQDGWIASGAGNVTSVNGQSGAVILNTDTVGEGATAKYFTETRTLATVLTGVAAYINNVAIVATDNVLAALGKLQGQINAIKTSIPAPEDQASILNKIGNGGITETYLSQDIIDKINASL